MTRIRKAVKFHYTHRSSQSWLLDYGLVFLLSDSVIFMLWRFIPTAHFRRYQWYQWLVQRTSLHERSTGARPGGSQQSTLRLGTDDPVFVSTDEQRDLVTTWASGFAILLLIYIIRRSSWQTKDPCFKKTRCNLELSCAPYTYTLPAIYDYI